MSDARFAWLVGSLFPLKRRDAFKHDLSSVLVHDVKTHFMFLASSSHSLWVDASICFDPMDDASIPYLVEYNSPVMIIGYIERNGVSLPTR